MENKLKHLEFIQNNIIRMSTNSFIIKGWAVTLVSAIFALSEKDSDKNYVMLSYFGILLFWYLNGFFLLQETRFRALYDVVRIKNESTIDFSMDISNYKSGRNTLWSSLFAKSIWPLYVFMFAIILIVMFGFN